jgi:hypothetical protein
LRTAVEFLHQFKEKAVRIDKTAGMSEAELADRIIIGKLCDRERPEFTAEMHALTRRTVAAVKQEQPS